VTVTVYVPAGVPFTDVVIGDDDDPPPQPAIAIKLKTILDAARVGRRRLPEKNNSEAPRTSAHAMIPMPGGEVGATPPPPLPDAVVPTATATGTAPPPVTLIDPGKLHIGDGVTAGVIPHVKFTVPLNDAAGVTVKLNVAVCPAAIVCEPDPPDATPNVKSGVMVPVPDKTTICEPVPASSATARFAVAAPVAAGVNVTLIVHVAAG
jgi:hypothetical protein